ncbi:MAG: glycosyltransferase [Candidatus Pacebacteria bacterium]|nr:glycosyltransferase [Candidatus Paceibacterota bacterium]
MRIIQLLTELRLAGAERVVLNLSKTLKQHGHDIAVIALSPPPVNAPSILPELQKLDIPSYSLHVTKATPWKLRALPKPIHDFQPDLIHAHLFHANIASRLMVDKHSIPLVNTVHIAERRRSAAWHLWLDRLTHGRCSCETAVSKAVRDFQARRIRVPPHTIPVIYNGIEPPPRLQKEDREALCQEWNVTDCTKIIGSVGRLAYQKGYDRLLKALPALAKHIPSGERWAVVLLGEGPLRPKLETLAQKKPDNLDIRLPGFRKDAARCIGAFDLFVMPSRYEGFGLTLVEAMAHGIPILASNVDSLPELIHEYHNGELLDFHLASPGAIAQAIATNLNRPRGPGKLPFSVENMADAYLDLYKNLMHGPAVNS